MALSITELKKGTLFQWEGQPFRVVDYNQKVMGRGGSIVNVRIKSLLDGKVLEKTFKGNEQLDSADVSNQTVQYLYNDGTNFFFMNGDSFEQFKNAGRADLAAKAEREIAICRKYQPQQLDAAQIEALVKEAVAETGATTKKDMGKVMQAVMAKAKGRADGKTVSGIAGRLLP